MRTVTFALNINEQGGAVRAAEALQALGRLGFRLDTVDNGRFVMTDHEDPPPEPAADQCVVVAGLCTVHQQNYSLCPRGGHGRPQNKPGPY